MYAKLCFLEMEFQLNFVGLQIRSHYWSVCVYSPTTERYTVDVVCVMEAEKERKTMLHNTELSIISQYELFFVLFDEVETRESKALAYLGNPLEVLWKFDTRTFRCL